MGAASRWTVGLVTAWAVALAVNRSLRRVRGRSMVPTLEQGDLVATLPVRMPRRGEVVLVRDPRDSDGARGGRGGHDAPRTQVKRVVGLPGEVVEVREGTLLIDGRRHREAHQHGRGPDGSLRVPPRHVAVLGDARDASTDSRSYGAVPLELVERRVPLLVRPRLRWLRSAPVALAPASHDRARSA